MAYRISSNNNVKAYTYVRYKAVNKGEEEKIAQALNKLTIEDLTLKVVVDDENKQTLLYGIGEQQLEVVASKLEERYKVKITLEKPRIAFRETIKKKVQVQGKHKKQSGGHGQYGDVVMELSRQEICRNLMSLRRRFLVEQFQEIISLL